MNKIPKTTTLAVIATLAGLVLTASSTQAAVYYIYNETFGGSGAADLNGTTADNYTGGNTWTASTDWKADGTIAGSTRGADDDSAFLAFAPVSGNVYNLSATVTLPTVGFSSSAWLGLGFTNGNDTGNFFSSPNNASPWMLYRNNSEVKTFDGPGTTGTNVGEGNFGGTITMSIELDTTAAQWTSEWFVDGSSVRTETFASNPTITNVGFGQGGWSKLDHNELQSDCRAGTIHLGADRTRWARTGLPPQEVNRCHAVFCCPCPDHSSGWIIFFPQEPRHSRRCSRWGFCKYGLKITDYM